MSRQRSLRRALRQKGRPAAGYFVTWDVDSRDAAQCARLRRFVYGDSSSHGGRTYHYPGLLEREGVQYLGQSVLFVTESRLRDLVKFLAGQGIGYVVRSGWLGPRSV